MGDLTFITTAADLPSRARREPQTHKKVRRLFEAHRLLSQGACSARELASLLGLDPTNRSDLRAVQRDLEDLRRLGVGLTEDSGTHRYSVEYRKPGLNQVEALATHAALRLFSHHAATKNKHYLNAMRVLAQSLPEGARELAHDATREVWAREDAGLIPDRHFDVVARAWFERRPLRFDYHKPGLPQPERGNELEVYFVEVSRSNLATYVIGRERVRRDAVRTFKLARMTGVTPLEGTYSVPPSFDPVAFLSDAWGVVGSGAGRTVEVRLRFSPDAAYRVLEGGYPNLTVEEMGAKDGSLLVEVRAGVDNTGLPRELMPWILGWGPRVEVLEPENVREHWLRELRETLRKYGGDTI